MKSSVVNDICIIESGYSQVDALNTKQFQIDMQKAMGQYKKILLDLTQTRFIDSSGLGILLALYRDLDMRDGKMALCSMNSAVATLFEMVKLSDIVPCFPAKEEALSYLKAE